MINIKLNIPLDFQEAAKLLFNSCFKLTFFILFLLNNFFDFILKIIILAGIDAYDIYLNIKLR